MINIIDFSIYVGCFLLGIAATILLQVLKDYLTNKK